MTGRKNINCSYSNLPDAQIAKVFTTKTPYELFRRDISSSDEVSSASTMEKVVRNKNKEYRNFGESTPVANRNTITPRKFPTNVKRKSRQKPQPKKSHSNSWHDTNDFLSDKSFEDFRPSPPSQQDHIILSCSSNFSDVGHVDDVGDGKRSFTGYEAKSHFIHPYHPRFREDLTKLSVSKHHKPMKFPNDVSYNWEEKLKRERNFQCSSITKPQKIPPKPLIYSGSTHNWQTQFQCSLEASRIGAESIKRIEMMDQYADTESNESELNLERPDYIETTVFKIPKPAPSKTTICAANKKSAGKHSSQLKVRDIKNIPLNPKSFPSGDIYDVQYGASAELKKNYIPVEVLYENKFTVVRSDRDSVRHSSTSTEWDNKKSYDDLLTCSFKPSTCAYIAKQLEVRRKINDEKMQLATITKIHQDDESFYQSPKLLDDFLYDNAIPSTPTVVEISDTPIATDTTTGTSTGTSTETTVESEWETNKIMPIATTATTTATFKTETETTISHTLTAKPNALRMLPCTGDTIVASPNLSEYETDRKYSGTETEEESERQKYQNRRLWCLFKHDGNMNDDDMTPSDTIDEEINGEIKEEMNGEMNEEMHGEMDEEMNGEMDEEMDGEMYEEMYEEMNGEMDEEINEVMNEGINEEDLMLPSEAFATDEETSGEDVSYVYEDDPTPYRRSSESQAPADYSDYESTISMGTIIEPKSQLNISASKYKESKGVEVVEPLTQSDIELLDEKTRRIYIANEGINLVKTKLKKRKSHKHKKKSSKSTNRKVSHIFEPIAMSSPSIRSDTMESIVSSTRHSIEFSYERNAQLNRLSGGEELYDTEPKGNSIRKAEFKMRRKIFFKRQQKLRKTKFNELIGKGKYTESLKIRDELIVSESNVEKIQNTEKPNVIQEEKLIGKNEVTYKIKSKASRTEYFSHSENIQAMVLELVKREAEKSATFKKALIRAIDLANERNVAAGLLSPTTLRPLKRNVRKVKPSVTKTGKIPTNKLDPKNQTKKSKSTALKKKNINPKECLPKRPTISESVDKAAANMEKLIREAKEKAVKELKKQIGNRIIKRGKHQDTSDKDTSTKNTPRKIIRKQKKSGSTTEYFTLSDTSPPTSASTCPRSSTSLASNKVMTPAAKISQKNFKNSHEISTKKNDNKQNQIAKQLSPRVKIKRKKISRHCQTRRKTTPIVIPENFEMDDFILNPEEIPTQDSVTVVNKPSKKEKIPIKICKQIPKKLGIPKKPKLSTTSIMELNERLMRPLNRGPKHPVSSVASINVISRNDGYQPINWAEISDEPVASTSYTQESYGVIQSNTEQNYPSDEHLFSKTYYESSYSSYVERTPFQITRPRSYLNKNDYRDENEPKMVEKLIYDTHQQRINFQRLRDLDARKPKPIQKSTKSFQSQSQSQGQSQSQSQSQGQSRSQSRSQSQSQSQSQSLRRKQPRKNRGNLTQYQQYFIPDWVPTINLPRDPIMHEIIEGELAFAG